MKLANRLLWLLNALFGAGVGLFACQVLLLAKPADSLGIGVDASVASPTPGNRARDFNPLVELRNPLTANPRPRREEIGDGFPAGLVMIGPLADTVFLQQEGTRRQGQAYKNAPLVLRDPSGSGETVYREWTLVEFDSGQATFRTSSGRTEVVRADRRDRGEPVSDPPDRARTPTSR